MAEPEDPLEVAETYLRDRAMTYPDAVEEFPWGHRAIKVKGKVFVFLHLIDGVFTVGAKLPDSAPYALTKPYAKPTEYGLGKHNWVTCTFRPGDDIPLDLLDEWVEESYRSIAPKKLVLALNAQQAGEPVAATKPAAKREPATKVVTKPATPAKPKRGPKTKGKGKGTSKAKRQ
jgi:predicted DNA-binding protein (MmcQ/YjbR family)